MRQLPQHRAVWLIVGCCLLAAQWGCCWQRPRHGVIVRGDFALELNRIPWMTGRGAEYEHDVCAEPECAGPGQPCQPGAGEACLSRGCKRPGAGAEGAAGGEAVAAAGCYNQPRFFPVPTRPAFSARADLAGPPVPPGVIRQPEGFSEAGGPMPVEDCPPRILSPTLRVPEPEVVPTPPAEKPSLERPTGPTEPSTSGLSLPKWLITPPENAAKPNPPAQPTPPNGWPLRR